MHGPWAPGGETLNREQKAAVIEELTERMTMLGLATRVVAH